MTTRPSVLALGARLFGIFVLLRHLSAMPMNFSIIWQLGLADCLICGYALLIIALARKLDRFAPPASMPLPQALTDNARRLLGLFLTLEYLPTVLWLPYSAGRLYNLQQQAAQMAVVMPGETMSEAAMAGAMFNSAMQDTIWQGLGVSGYTTLLALGGLALLLLPWRNTKPEGRFALPLAPTPAEAVPEPVAEEQYVCGECNAAVGEDDKVCPACGANIAEVERFYCSECGKEIAENEARCPHCGK